MNPLWFGASAQRKASISVIFGVIFDLSAGGTFGGVVNALLLPINMLITLENVLEFLIALFVRPTVVIDLIIAVFSSVILMATNLIALLAEVAVFAVLIYAGQGLWNTIGSLSATE